MIYKPSFPTNLHEDVALKTKEYFLKSRNVDTVLIVNSCARGQAVAESDLDLAILVTQDTSPAEIRQLESGWEPS